MRYEIKRHTKRPIRYIEQWEHGDWRMKIYGISQDGEYPEDLLIQIAKDIAAGLLPAPALTAERYGLGFLVIHQAEMFNQIIID